MADLTETADHTIVGRMQSGKIVLSVERETNRAHFGIYAQNLTVTEALLILPLIDPRRPMTADQQADGITVPLEHLAMPGRTAARQRYDAIPSDVLAETHAALTAEAKRLPQITDTANIVDRQSFARLGEIARDMLLINDVLTARGERTRSAASIFGSQQQQSASPTIHTTNLEDKLLALKQAWSELQRDVQSNGPSDAREQQKPSIQKDIVRLREGVFDQMMVNFHASPTESIDHNHIQEAENNRIYGFIAANRFASNMWPWSKESGSWVCVGDLAPVTYNGITYPSAEHAYVAQKTTDEATRRRIAQLPSAPIAKVAGRRLPIRADWDHVKNRIMHEIVRAKFETHADLAKKLLATGNRELIEANTHNDRYWGVDTRSGQGQNMLGKILMSVRDELRTRTADKQTNPPRAASQHSVNDEAQESRTITIRFANASAPAPTDAGTPVFYVGRSPWVVDKFTGSIWERDLSNGFKVTATTPRGEAVRLFAADLEHRLAASDKTVRQALNRIAKAALNNSAITLVCHCHPQACHSHVIAKTISTALQKMGHDVKLPQAAEIERAAHTKHTVDASISR